MIYRFEGFELDTDKVELREDGASVAIEPQVFALLLFLVDNRDRMVSKDEIVEKVWDGRIVSDSAVTSRVKSARRALGDDGKAQRFIRTVHGKGFRFVADARETGGTRVLAGPDAPDSGFSEKAEPAARPSIAVLPFRLVGVAGPHAAIAEALPHELIAELSRLRWLFVIARGSSFRFRSAEADVARVGDALGVRYCLSGVVEILGDRMIIAVELSETRDGGVIWGERYQAAIGGVHDIRTQIISDVVSALELQIPQNEARLARLKSPDHLDAWSAYHLGIQHMYRFNRADNSTAAVMFARAVEIEPGFARAHAGLSFAHFTNAFLRYTDNREKDASEARRFAERGLELDPFDPFVNFTMGRSFWLVGDLDGGLSWLDRATSLSPNYAQGRYARAWTQTLLGDGAAAQENVDTALALSPLDPMLYAMLGVRAMTHTLRGEDAEAARWADKAARAPGAHILIALIALAMHALNGDDARAGEWAAMARARNPTVTQADFFAAFPFALEDTKARIKSALSRYGF